MEDPITFKEPSYAVMDADLNMVCTTPWGNLAIFSTLAVAEQVATQQRIRKNLKIVPVMIKPVEGA